MTRRARAPWCTPLLACLLALAWAPNASAVLIEVSFGGSLTSVSDPGGFFGPIAVGSPFTGTITLEDSAPDQDVVPGSGFFYGDVATLLVEVEMGGVVLAAAADSPLVSARTINTLFGDLFELTASDFALPASGSFDLTLTLSDLSATALAGELLSDVPFVLAAWPDVHSLTLNGSVPGVGSFSLEGELESLEVVPEPTAALLLGGLACLAAGAKRRQAA